MASKRKPARETPSLPFDDAGELERIRTMAEELGKRIAALPLDARVDALNAARTALHGASPFRDEPVDLVLWVKSETVDPNDYNPNTVAPPEMRLLALSIDADGYTQPIVTTGLDNADGIGSSETVDGFHRGRVGKEVPSVRSRVHGYLPITRIKGSRSGRADRMASTIRHNRARGKHGVEAMSSIVRLMHLAGWTDEKIQEELGMERDEVLRLKQTTGLAALFAATEFSEAWTPETDSRSRAKK
jgi:ParB-like chromosome segregation protein Spo0J